MDEFSQAVITPPAPPAPTPSSPPPPAEQPNEFDHAQAMPADEFKQATATANTDDPRIEGFVKRMWAQDYGQTLLNTPGKHDEILTWSKENQPKYDYSDQSATPTYDPATGKFTEDYTQQVQKPSMMDDVYHAIGGAMPTTTEEPTATGAGQFARSTASPETQQSKDRYYRQLYAYLVNKGRDPFNTPISGEDKKALGLDPLTGQPVTESEGSENALKRGIFKGTIGAIGNAEAYAADVGQSVVDFFRNGPSNGGQPIGQPGALGEFAQNVREGEQNIDQVNPASQTAQTDPYSLHGLGEHISETASSIASQLFLTGGMTAAGAGAKTASQIAFFGQMAGDTANATSEQTFHALVQQGMDPVQAKREALVVGAGSAAVQTFLQARVGQLGRVLGTADAPAVNKALNAFAQSMGRQVAAGRGADAVDQLSQYAATGQHPDVERFIAGGIGDAIVGGLFATKDAHDEFSAENQRREFIANTVAKKIFNAMGVPAENLEAAAKEVVEAKRSGEVTQASDFNDIARKHGAPIPEEGEPVAAPKKVENTAPQPQDATPAEKPGAGSTSSTPEEGMPATVPTLNPESPGVKRVTRPPGGWGEETAPTPPTPVTPAKEEQSAHVDVLRAQAESLRDTLKESQDLSAKEKKAVTQQIGDLDEMLNRAQAQLTGKKESNNQEVVRPYPPQLPAPATPPTAANPTPPAKPAVERVAPVQVGSDELKLNGEVLATVHGVKYDGAQEGVEEGEYYQQFTDPTTKSTFLVGPDEYIGDKLAASRAAYEKKQAAKAPPVPAEKPAEAKPAAGSRLQEQARHKADLARHVRDLPEGTAIHGTDLSHLPSIAKEGLQPGATYQQGGSSDESMVYGSRVRGGEAGGALPAIIGRYKTTPVLLVMHRRVLSSHAAGGGNVTLHSPNAEGQPSSYVKPGDIVEAIVAGHGRMSLADAVKLAKHEGETSPAPRAENGPKALGEFKEGDVVHFGGGEPYRIEERSNEFGMTHLINLTTGEYREMNAANHAMPGKPPAAAEPEPARYDLTPPAEPPADFLPAPQTGTLTSEGESNGGTDEPVKAGDNDQPPVPGGEAEGGRGAGGGELGAAGEEGMGEEQPLSADKAVGGGGAGGSGDSGAGAGAGPLFKPDEGGNGAQRSTGAGGEAGYPGLRPGSAGADQQEPSNVGNFRMMTPAWTRPEGGEITRATNNVAAIRLAKEILAQDRPATAAEQAIIAKFTGWGGVSAVFTTRYNDSKTMEALARELKTLLTEEEYNRARQSIQNAHFTDGNIVAEMWKGMKVLGFDGGRILEPSMGMGYFFSLMPEMGRESNLVGVELDTLTGSMARLLYPDAKVHVNAYQRVSLPAGYFDVAIGNVPFADTRIREDAAYNKIAPMVHDYFFLKALDHVRPGGVVAFITSKGTMDSATSETTRRALAAKADLVAAFRLPTAAHKEQAGTDVVTDLIILRKREPGEAAAGGAVKWIKSVDWQTADAGEPFSVNEYFHANPNHVLGTIDHTGKMYRGASMGVTASADWKERLAAAMAALPKIYSPRATTSRAFEPQRIPDAGETKEQGYAVRDGKLYRKDAGELVEQKAGRETVDRIEGMLAVRDALRDLFKQELAGENSAPARKKLNDVYDHFRKQHGALRDKKNTRAIGRDPDGPVLHALELESKGKITKADVFTKSTLRPNLRQEKVADVGRAMGVVLNESAKVDIARLAQLTGLDPLAVEAELVEKKLAFQDPAHGWTPGDVYLSGNVKKKLSEAISAAAIDPKYEPNVKALEEVQPADVPPTDIDARMGAAWVPESDHEQFVKDTFGNQPRDLRIYRNPEVGGWIVVANAGAAAFTGPSAQRFITQRANIKQTLDAALNNTPHIVYDEVEDGKREINKPETDKANVAVENLRDAFKEWLWKDDERRERLARHYNDTFNTHRNIQYNGGHLTFPGMNPMITLQPWQVNGVWMQLMNGRGLMAHEVGTGKTFMEVATAMEMKRLGLANKPTIAVPKDLVDQTTREAQALYPGARILSTSGRFEAADRKRTVSAIATGDWDIVIMTHEHLNYLSMRPEAIEEFIKSEQDEIENVIMSMKSTPGIDKRIVKQMEKAKDKVEQRWLGLLARAKKDNAVHFEETGIDHLFVDEAHAFKALPVYTQHRNVKGIPSGSSDRAKLLFMKARYLYGIRGNKGLSMLTGTPITNTMAELFNFQRYLQFEELKQLGIHAFDAWASTFGQITTKMEFTHAGTVKDVSAFSSFINLPELRKIVGADMDVVRSPAELKRPKMHTEAVEVDETPTQRLYRLLTLYRVTKVKPRPGPGDDMHLLITGDGAKAAIDPRLVLPGAPDEPGSKLNRLVDNVLKVHRERPDRLQFIFSDTGVWPTSWGFSAYQDIVDKLVAGGIPRERIVDARQFSGSKAKRLRAQASMQANAGEISVILGSTKKVGTGLNAQRYCIALHHLDAPYLPGDIEQRNGRGFRQGNLLYEEGKPLRVFAYVTRKSADAFRWQLVTRKSKFINEFQDGTLKARNVEEQDIATLTPDQIMALASGNPKLMDKIQLDSDVKQMELQRRFHQQAAFAHKDRIKQLTAGIPEFEEQIKASAANYEAMKAMTSGPLKITIGNKEYTDVELAGEALSRAFKGLDDGALRDAPGYRRQIATWGPVQIIAQANFRDRTADMVINMTPPTGAVFDGGYATRTVDPKKQIGAVVTAILRGAQPRDYWNKTLSDMKEQLARGKAEQERPYSREKEYEQAKKKAATLAEELRGVDQPKDADGVLNSVTPAERMLLERWYAERLSRIGNSADATDFAAESGDEDELAEPEGGEQAETPTELTPMEKRDAIIDQNITHKGEGPPGAVQTQNVGKRSKPGPAPAGGGKILVGLTTAVEGAIEAAGKALAFFTNGARNMRERFARYEQDYGDAAKPLEDGLIGYITARETGKAMGDDLAHRTLQGLSEEQADNLIAYKLDGYRRADNMAFANKMARTITPPDLDKDDVANAIFAAFNSLDAVNPADLSTEMATQLGNIDQELVDNWVRLMASDIDYTPEALAERETKNAADYFKADDTLRDQWEHDPAISGANDWWEQNVAPWIDQIRVRRKLPMNPYFKHFNALNFVTDTHDDLFPRDISRGVGQFNRFTYSAERKRFIGPAKEYLSKVIAGHYKTDKETDLFDVLQQIGVPEKATTIDPEGVRRGEFLGKAGVELLPFDVEPSNRRTEIRFLPKDLADTNPRSPGDLVQVETPGELKHRAIADAARNFFLGLHLAGNMVGVGYRAAGNARRNMYSTRPQATATVSRMLGEVAMTPVRAMRHILAQINVGAGNAADDTHEAIQETLEALGASSHRQADAKSFIGSVWTFGDKILYDRVWGAENIVRRYVLENHLRARFGDKYVDRVLASVKDKSLTPPEGARVLLAQLGEAGRVDVARSINNLLGWLDRDTRSPWMNKVRIFLPYIGTHVSTIPSELASLMSGNVNWGSVGRAAKAGNWKHAAALVAAGILSGALGTYLAMDLVNWAINGHGMQANEDGHRLDIQFPGKWYFGVDSGLQRAARLVGLNAESNRGERGAEATMQATAAAWYNTFWTSSDPGFELLSNILLGKSMRVDESGDAYSSSRLRGIPTPYVQNTAQALEDGKPVSTGIIKDLNTNLLGAPLTHDDRSPDQVRRAAYELAVQRAAQILAQPPGEERNARLSGLLNAVGKNPVAGGAPLDAKNVYRDALYDAKRPLINSLVQAVRAGDRKAYDAAVQRLNAAGLPVRHLIPYLVERKFLDSTELQRLSDKEVTP